MLLAIPAPRHHFQHICALVIHVMVSQNLMYFNHAQFAYLALIA